MNITNETNKPAQTHEKPSHSSATTPGSKEPHESAGKGHSREESQHKDKKTFAKETPGAGVR